MNQIHPQLAPICHYLEQQLLGKPKAVRLALSCLLASGHLLIEDLPGAGKTSLAKWLAAGFGLSFQRIQFTSDLLPADIIGVSVYEPPTQQFIFHPGPIFNHLVLADELNRASPRTQSALLEAMEEQQVSTDGQSYPLEAPFFVIATQNPREQLGTFDLPESQLDRFAMRLSIGFPDLNSELAMLKRSNQAGESLVGMSIEALTQLQQAVEQVHCSDALLDYLLRLIHCSRALEGANPLSPRCSLTLLACAKAWAYLHHQQHVSPEDVQAVFSAVSAHRLGRGDSGEAYAKQILTDVDPYNDLS
ncbi:MULTISPECIES: AAA family ATPase [unclassified Agarivorans]|uniref:AAA family ATPase n=1 Tax=unclassified Agarivorans TaxID=2636026 RepID=UPI0026E1EA59|nr:MULTISPECIES: AAA family ATPase [unclassified Agarivorans]MDO6683980.1 AAA family ATPase [Agarivorans sp. 3_MG-2023]MDO6714287.1 AAA family ATPase [Agarivorans sp. 2_MG-2023]MDO6762476.1 AAA family ATPase [Agarivorans sp. 1_MG-2023]